MGRAARISPELKAEAIRRMRLHLANTPQKIGAELGFSANYVRVLFNQSLQEWQPGRGYYKPRKAPPAPNYRQREPSQKALRLREARTAGRSNIPGGPSIFRG